jgi:16S rRNA C1402 N4-methylase RsmH
MTEKQMTEKHKSVLLKEVIENLKIKDNDFTIASPASRGRITPYTIFSFTKRNELPALIPELFQSAKV